MNHAYRIASSFDGVVLQQMSAAIVFMREMRHYKPAICGNALWQWAGNRCARDVDIFMKKRWFARWAIQSALNNPFLYEKVKEEVAGNYPQSFTATLVEEEKAYEESGYNPPRTYEKSLYGLVSVNKPVSAIRFTAQAHGYNPLSTVPIQLDFILGPWKEGAHACRGFDYGHLEVAWSPKTVIFDGSTYYRTGLLQAVRGTARPEHVVKSKLCIPLWGRSDANIMLRRVYQQLDDLWLDTNKRNKPHG